MKKLGFGKRLTAMLLVLAMLVAYVPGFRANAATGDIVSGVDTGLVSGSFDTSDTISWPIKIYDYLNDGMLFEYSSAQDTSMTVRGGGSYGGGQPMPMIYGDENIGVDFTSVNGYFPYNSSSGTHVASYAISNWGNENSYSVSYDTSSQGATEVMRSIVQPVKDVSPMYMNLEYVDSGSSKSSGWLSNFARDDKQYYSKDEVRYMVIVYRTNETYDTVSGGKGHVLRPYWAVSDASYASDYSYWDGAIDISDLTDSWGWKQTGTLVGKAVRIAPSTDEWTYQVIDMKTNDTSDGEDVAHGIAANWDSIDEDRVAGIGCSLPLTSLGEEMDVSHVAYFSSAELARYFGERAVAFDNDPGEYLGYTITMDCSFDGGSFSSSYEEPTLNAENAQDFTSWSSSTHSSWEAEYMDTSRMNYHGLYYMNVTNTDSDDPDMAVVFRDTGYQNFTDYRYVTIVYRTHGITDPMIGFWVSDYFYSSTCTVGKDASCRVSATASEDEWVAFTYDLQWLNSQFGYTLSGKVDTFTDIGIIFPGFTSSSQSMDIAYIDFHSSASAAESFGTAAENYLNNSTYGSGTSVSTTLRKSSEPLSENQWNMGSNQAFTMLYASTGGGWLDTDSTTGGTNTWSNGYYSYQIGYSYMMGPDPDDSSINIIREEAWDQDKDYRVSDSIFLLNSYASTAGSLYGVDYDTDSDGDVIASTKRFDMSQLDLGYTLYNTMKEGGVMTAGLLESGIGIFTGMDGELHRVMQYKDDTIHYIATLLRDTLCIPERDYWGYNYNYVMGTPSAQYCEDVDGDGKLDLYDEDLDGDGHLDDVNEDKNRDGILELSEDIDHDGRLDVYEDLDLDGILDISEDLDEDGHLDVFEDLDRDGLIDPGEDKDGDGKLDVGEDVDYDGHLDVFEDVNHNGILDAGEDVDGDGHLDVDEDLNGNGKLDAFDPVYGEDLNQNGKLDLGEDVDGDGKLDMGEDRNHNGILDEGEDLNGNGRLDDGEDLNHNGILDEGEDLNGNGKLDLEDINGNGILDLGEDLDGDGHLDAGEDLNNNGILDDGEDINGNGKLDLQEDLDGDGHLDVNEDRNGNGILDECDLATALREDLEITFPDSASLEDQSSQGTMGAPLGDYESTSAKFNAGPNGENLLIGPYLLCKENIETAYDAAYYLLHNLFVANSYNQAEDDYHYLVMTKATVSDEDKEAYVFDAGFSTADGGNATQYDLDTGRIYQTAADDKHNIYYTSSYLTTLNPFLPINDDGEGPEEEYRYNGTPYVREDGATDITTYGDTYALRNYNYVMAAVGEFVYHYGEDLFFDFEGDDDVYMFINDELVLDIGAAHSITKVGFQMNDYVDKARSLFKNMTGYEPGISEDAFLKVLATARTSGEADSSISDAEYLRWHKLNLVDGQDYSIDFYYMERHGWGANMRIATNIVMTDPTMETDKTAYQGTDIYGDPIEIDYGSLIDDSKPINYGFSITNEGNTKLYRLAFEDANIGVSLTPDDGLQTYGQPSATEFTLYEDSELRVTGLNGVFNLDGDVYWVSSDGTFTSTSGEISTVIPITYDPENTANNLHSLTLYQFGSTTLNQDQVATVVLGTGANAATPKPNDLGIYPLQADTSHKLSIAGVRVSDANGRKLDPADLVFTVKGYASEEAYQEGIPNDTITVRVADNIELKQFLTNLQDPKHQTGEGEGVPEGKSALYWGAGLWRHATVSVSGMWYTLSESQQEAMVFNNTVYTTAYKSISSGEPIDGHAKHRVYCPGEPMYYQWADNPVYLTLDRLWGDVMEVSQSAGTPMNEQKEGIDLLDAAGIDSFTLEICDKGGDSVTVSDNFYDNGVWKTFPGSTLTAEQGKRSIYYKHYFDWYGDDTEKVYVYYWSDSNTNMVAWPGVEMSAYRTDGDGKQVFKYDIPSDARYVIFNNGKLTEMIQSADIPVPLVDYDKVSWDEDQRLLTVRYDNPGKHMFYAKIRSDEVEDVTAMIPVAFYVTETKDKTYVLDYGLSTEELNSGGLLFQGDELLGNEKLGNKTFTEAKLMGVTTVEPTYLSEYSAEAEKLGNINRISFSSQSPVKEKEDRYSFDLGEGKYYLNSSVDPAGNLISYIGGNYSMNTQLWFTPDEFMDEPYELWLAISVHAKDAYGPGETVDASVTDPVYYHAPTGLSSTEDTTGKDMIDIKSEVQMYKKVTVIPATVIYYEDDFADITYDDQTDGVFVHHGDGSGALTQGIEQTVPYGQDATYQHSANDEMSGDSVTALKISDTEQKASFTFNGTGFELISRTNAYDSASLVVELIKINEQGEQIDMDGDGDVDGDDLRRIPVITEFTSTSTAECTHKHHNANGHCTYCNLLVGHDYQDGVCTGCNAVQSSYYLIGNINGQDIDVGDDPVDSEQYRFNDGTLTVTFDKDSYVVVKEGVAGDQYWTNGYHYNASSVMLYNTTTYGSNINADKLHVPGGVPVTFHLVDNGTGIMTLSYSTETQRYGSRTVFFDNSIKQWEEVYIYYWATGFVGPYSFPGVQMSKVEDETDLYTYVVPSDANMVIFNNGEGDQTVDLTVPGDGYVYNGNKWSVYGEESSEDDETNTVYFILPDGWTTPTVWAWGDGGNVFSSWPGGTMTQVDGSRYAIDLPAEATSIIFSDNGSNQTPDMKIYGDGYTYDYAKDRWLDPNGNEMYKTVYFKNSDDWAVPYAWAWTASGSNSRNCFDQWPGAAMTQVEGTSYWSVEVPVQANYILFTDNNGTQTDNQVIGDTDLTYEDGKWTDEEPASVLSKGKEIHQVPVIRVSDLEYGSYKVTISGMPQYADDIDWGKVTELNEAVTNAQTEQDKATAQAAYDAYLKENIKDTYLYIDGVRIYQPVQTDGIDGSHPLYAIKENGAAFKELRTMILEGKAAMATYDSESTTVYSGNYSWTENRNGVLYDIGTDGNGEIIGVVKGSYIGNQLDSIDDYMLVGPNNEAYVRGEVKASGEDFRNEAIVFYVTEDLLKKEHSLQVGVRGIDMGLFMNGESTGIAATLYQGVSLTSPTGESLVGWSPVAAISSGTEQYYEIDYAACPYTVDDSGIKTYQVALYVRNGMVSFTNVKYNNLSIVDLNAEKTSYCYDENGMLVTIDSLNAVSSTSESGTGEIDGTAIDFDVLSKQMSSVVYTSELEVPEESETDASAEKPVISLDHPTLSFEDEIRYNVYYTVDSIEDVVDMGLILFGQKLADGTIANADEVISGYTCNGELYMAQTNGIPAAKMGDTVYFKVYAKLSNGSYVYSDIAGYDVTVYANSILSSQTSSSYMKSLVIAMLNYGATAQTYFGSDSTLVNSTLTAEQLALVEAYHEGMVSDIVSIDSTKVAAFAFDGTSYTSRYASVSFEGALAINYYFTAAHPVDGDMKLYYWDQETYENVDALTADNAIGSVTMVATDAEGQYWGEVAGLAAGQIDETVYVAGVYESDGVAYCSNVIAYSIAAYAKNIAENDASAQQDLAQATVVYGFYAKQYFANL